MSNLKEVIEGSFTQYAGAVLQSRALVDARDCLKPSARQIFYCMDKYKYIASKPYQKTMAAIGDSMKHFYIHGNSSAEGIIMRAGQPFAMRYPLVDVKGNGGNLMASGNWAAPRYTEARLSKVADCLFIDIDKDTIDDWRDNYADNEQYPSVLPTKGFYNIINGTMGIGIGAASSIPQFNITDVNNALCKLLDNPNISFEEIYCPVDFATGALLLNESEVKESLKNGTGAACKLRSVVTYDKKENVLVITEIPYAVYTNTICEELETLINSEDNPGIERFNDLTGQKPLIKIYLTKKANVNKVIKYLYKNTSIQSYYSINMTMLDNGRFPRVFTWKEALQAHINHEKIVYRNAFNFDLKKIKKRIHIIDGLLICLAHIEEVVQTIKSSASTAAASVALQSKFVLDEEQAKAVLDMKLSKLAHLEVTKLEKEKSDLEAEENRIEGILNDTIKFNNELKAGWAEIAKKYGDPHRTKILDLEGEEDEPAEIKQLQLSLTNKNNIFVTETSSLYTQRRGGVGSKIKMESGEYVLDSLSIKSTDTILLFAQNGNLYPAAANNVNLDTKIAVESLTGCAGEHIIAISALNKHNEKPFIVFITKKGYLKKTSFSEYNVKRTTGIKALTLEPEDEIVNVLFIKDEQIAMMTANGNFVIVESTPIRAIGRVARGIKGVKLNEGDYVVCGRVIKSTAKSIVSVSKNGYIKQTSISEFNVQSTNTKGSKIQKLNESDLMADFLPINDHSEIVIASTRACIKVSMSEIPNVSRGTIGVHGIKLGDKDFVIALS